MHAQYLQMVAASATLSKLDDWHSNPLVVSHTTSKQPVLAAAPALSADDFSNFDAFQQYQQFARANQQKDLTIQQNVLTIQQNDLTISELQSKIANLSSQLSRQS